MPTQIYLRNHHQTATAAPASTTGENSAPTEGSFADTLEMLNPLHYIPVVSNLYQNATHTPTPPIASLIGGAVFGGITGLAIAGIGCVWEAATGKNLVESAMDLFTDNSTNADTDSATLTDMQQTAALSAYHPSPSPAEKTGFHV
jgi:hypothetical protein